MLGMTKATSAEEITQYESVVRKSLCIGDMKKNTHRERERESHKEVSPFIKNGTVTNNNQPLQKVTKSLYIVTHLGQLPFMLFTQMARTWALTRG